MMRKIVTLAMSCVLAAVLFGGCATSGEKSAKGNSDKDVIASGLSAWKAGLMEKNLDKLMALHSEGYKDAEGRTKSDLKGFIADAIGQGYLDSLKVDTESATVTVNGTDATAGPV